MLFWHLILVDMKWIQTFASHGSLHIFEIMNSSRGSSRLWFCSFQNNDFTKVYSFDLFMKTHSLHSCSRPFYGYHEEEELFLKIYFYFPGDVKRWRIIICGHEISYGASVGANPWNYVQWVMTIVSRITLDMTGFWYPTNLIKCNKVACKNTCAFIIV